MEEGKCLIILCQYGIRVRNHVAQLLYSSYLLSFCQEQCNIALNSKLLVCSHVWNSVAKLLYSNCVMQS